MSLVAIANCSVIAALHATQFRVDFLTTKHAAVLANQHLARSDIFYHQGNMRGAVDNFYSAFAPTAQDDEVNAVVDYLDNLLHKGKSIKMKELKKTLSQDQMHCLVFVECGETQEAFRDLQHDNLEKRDLPWTFRKIHQTSRQSVQQLYLAMSYNAFGELLQGSNINSYCKNGACLSWTNSMGEWNSGGAGLVIDDLLQHSGRIAMISAKAKSARWMAAAGNFCIGSRSATC